MLDIVEQALTAPVAELVQDSERVLGIAAAIPELAEADRVALGAWGLPRSQELRPAVREHSVLCDRRCSSTGSFLSYHRV